MSNVQINYYEHDARRPKIDTLGRIAEALGVSPDVLLGEEMSEKQARKRLYAVFSRFDGRLAEIDGKTLVWFNELDLGHSMRATRPIRQSWLRQKRKKRPKDGRKRKKLPGTALRNGWN